MKTFFAIFFAICGVCRIAEARAYVPLGVLESTRVSTRSVFMTAKSADRPVLPGMRPVEVELMEDVLRRKNPHKVGNDRSAAHESIIRNFLRSPAKQAHAKGMLAESLYLEKNPTWCYVKSPNATQHDLYTWINGRRTPFTAQVKTHSTANSAVYAREMGIDHRSNLFLVPDDHVGPLKDYLRVQLADLRARGLTADANVAAKQLARVRGLGFTAKELDTRYTKAARYCLRERNATYVSLGAGVAMVLGPGVWEWWSTGALSNPTKFNMVRAGSILGAERAATFALARFGSSALQGGLRGNIITGIVVIGVDTSFSIYENGGSRAFHSASFYTHLSGSFGAWLIGSAVGGAVGVTATEVAAPTGFFAPLIGVVAGFASGAIAGMAGYYVGQGASRKILEFINPDFLHDAEKAAFRAALEEVTTAIAILQKNSV